MPIASATSTNPPPITDSATIGALTVRPARPRTWFIPVAKLSPISHATISMMPWMPKVNMADSTDSPVKFRMPSQVVQPPASESRSAAVPISARRQFVNIAVSISAQSRGRKRISTPATARPASPIRIQFAA